MSTDLKILFWDGYPDPRPGDFVTVYRGDGCVGNISCATTGGFSWALTCFGLWKRGHDYETYDEARTALVEAFVELCASIGLTIEGLSKTPSNHVPPQTWILEIALAKTASKELGEYMRTETIQRWLMGMVEYDRSRILSETRKRFRELEAKELAAFEGGEA